MTLDEVRQQYPAYANVPDQQLADALYKKYYAPRNVDRSAFDNAIGFKPYDNPLSVTGKALQNVPGQVGEALQGATAAVAGGAANIIQQADPANQTPAPAPVGNMADQIAADFVKPHALLTPTVGNAPSVLGNVPAEARAAAVDALKKVQIGAEANAGELAAGQQQPNIAPGDIGDKLLYDTVSGVASMAPAVAASVVLRNPAPMIAMGGIMSAGDAYAQAKAAGASDEDARKAAMDYGAVGAAGSAVSAGPLLKEGVGLFQRAVTEALVNAGVSASSAALNSATDLAYSNPNLTITEIAQRVAEAATVGGVSGVAFGVGAHMLHGGSAPSPDKPAEPTIAPAPSTAPEPPVVENALALPAPGVLLALPPPTAPSTTEPFGYRPNAPRPQGTATEPLAPTTTPDQANYQAQIAVQKTRQAETQALLDSAKQTITPVGTFTPAEVGGDIAQRVNTWRSRTGRNIDMPITVEDMANAKVGQGQIDALIAQRRPAIDGQVTTPDDVMSAIRSKNIMPDANFADFAYRTTGSRNVARMNQTQLAALHSAVNDMPVHPDPVTLPIADANPFTEAQYAKAVDAIRTQGRFTLQAVKDAIGAESNKIATQVRDAMVQRGQLVQRSASDFRLFDNLGAETQPTPSTLPPAAFTQHVVREMPISAVRVRQDGKSIGKFTSPTAASDQVQQIRSAEVTANKTPAQIAVEPAGGTAFGVLQNRYDEQGNLIGQAAVDSYRNRADAEKAADQLNNPDTGARYTQTNLPPVEPTSAASAPAEVSRISPPPALAGRLGEVRDGVRKIANQREMPLLGTKAQLVDSINGNPRIEGNFVQNVRASDGKMHLERVIKIATAHLDPSLSTEEVINRLGAVMDHELIHSLTASGVLHPESAGWKTLAKYAARTKRPNSTETYLEYAKRLYKNVKGYDRPADFEEEAIAEAFRHWAANRRTVLGKPAAVFRQLVTWFQKLIGAVPHDVFASIESGKMVREALTPKGSDLPRAKAADTMAKARADVAKAQNAPPAVAPDQQAARENLVRTRSRDFIQARDQAREDRYGRSGPKTVIGTTPPPGHSTGALAPRDDVEAIVKRFQSDAGQVPTPGNDRLKTYLPEDVPYLQRVADAQDKAVHNPKADATVKAYTALTHETRGMFDAMKVKVEPWSKDGSPYTDRGAMMDDVKAGRLKMRVSKDMFGEGARNKDHPLNKASGVAAGDGTPLTHNDLLRAVHDVYGFGRNGWRGSPRDAYNAYHEHARLLSPEARRALATETLAQDAWHNYGPHLRRADGTVARPDDLDYLPPDRKEFAEQKAFLLPEDLVAADPGWARAAAADGAVSQHERFMIVYHGTPHEVDKFSSDKIGTGEGAQAYGHGLYFAGKKEVAQWYRDTLTGDTLEPAKRALAKANGDVDAAIGAATKEVDRLKALDLTPETGSARRDSMVATQESNLRELAAYKELGDWRKAGRLYHVEVPDDSELMDWDKPLSEQPAGVREKLQAVAEGQGSTLGQIAKDMFDGKANDISGDIFYQWLSGHLDSDQKASQTLTESGVPGHKYTGHESQSTNYVIYDDSRIELLGHEEAPFVEELPGGRFYGKADRSIGATMAPPETKPVDFSTPREGNQFFGGALASHQLEMARTGADGAIMVYLRPEEFATLSGHPAHPEQEAYNALVAQGYKFNRLPSLVVDGYAGKVRVTDADGTFIGAALGGRTDKIPVVVYPKRGESPGLITSLEGKRGDVAWPADNRAENFPEARGAEPKYSLNANFGERVPDNDEPPVRDAIVQPIDSFIGKALHWVGRSKKEFPFTGGSIFDVRMRLQDRMLPVKELIENVKAAGGGVSDRANAYLREQLYHGKVFAQVEQREQDLYLPLFEAMKQNRDKVSPKELEDYLYARHAPERNAFLRARGAPSDNPSGMSDAEAHQIIDKLAKAGKQPTLDALAKLADRISADTTQTRIEAGLIDPSAATNNPYEHYVPLRGFDEESLDPDETVMTNTRARSGKGFSVGGREDRSVTGRSRKAGDILGHLILQNTEAVIRSEKNDIAKAMVRLAQENPNIDTGVEILRKAPTRLVVGDNGMIRSAGDPNYRQDPHILTAKMGGQEVIMHIADDRVARALRGDYVAAGNGLTNAIMKYFGAFTRYQALVNTTLSPNFLIANPLRDLQEASVIGQQFDIKGFERKLVGGVPGAMAGIREVLFGGTANSDWAKLYNEMKDAGGTVEFMGIHDLENVVKRVRRGVETQGTNPTARQAREMLTGAMTFIEHTNKILENGTRLSAFKAARDAGYSTEQSAYIAKNITVNFNKGGEWKNIINSLWLFYNAGMQGTTVMMNALKSPKVQKIVAGIVVAGAAQEALNQWAGGQDDQNKNGTPDYQEIPDYVLEHNWVVMDHSGVLKALGVKNGYFMLPLPPGFGVFHNFGRNMAAMALGKKSPGAAMMSVLGTTVGALNPLGNSGVLNTVAPTFLDPVVDLTTNTDFAGSPIVPQRPTYGAPVPNSQKYWNSTAELPKWVASQLNSLTGGDAARPGMLDYSPETLQYVFDYLTGSAVKDVIRTGTTGYQLATGDYTDINVGNISMARRFVGDVGDRGNTNIYFQNAQEVGITENEIKLFEKDGNTAAARAAMAAHPADVRSMGVFKATEANLADMRKMATTIQNSRALSDTQKRQRLQQIKDRESAAMARANALYFSAVHAHQP